MSKVRTLLKFAQACCAQARAAIAAATDGDLRQADESQCGRSVVQAAFPKSDL